MLAGLLAPLAAGGAAIIPAGGKFSASTHWKDAVEHQATFYTAVPTMHQVICICCTPLINGMPPIAQVESPCPLPQLHLGSTEVTTQTDTSV